MVFTGVHIVDGKIQRWKVEDSYGTEGETNGYYIMNDNFFEKYVSNIVVHKKYMTEEQRRLLEQKPIVFNPDEHL